MPSDDEAAVIDTFEFDENMAGIIDENHAPLLSADSPTKTTTTTAATHPGKVASTTGASGEPFMLGDYMEKGHFFASTSMIRNEVLECVRLSEFDNDNALVAKMECEGSKKKMKAGDDCVVFRCIHCKDNKDRADMSAIRPKVRV